MNALDQPSENARVRCREPDRSRSALGFRSIASRISAAVLSVSFMPALLLVATPNLSAAPTENISAGFDAANKLYEQGKFTEAVAAYEKLLDSGAVSPAIYFNLGNAFYKAGKIGNALAAYREAERSAPRDADIRANLRFVRDQIQGPTAPPGRWQRWLGRFTINEWAVLASVVFWLWLLVLASMQFRPAWRSSLRTLAFLGGSATAITAACLASALLAGSSKTAIVVTQEAVVRNGPLAESPTAYVVHDGAELQILDHKGDWFQVSAGNRIGWLKQDQVEVFSQRDFPRTARDVRL